MDFFNALTKLTNSDESRAEGNKDERLREAESLTGFDSPSPEYPDGKGVPADPAEMAAPPKTSEYDRVQWQKKLKRILEKLPDSQAEWGNLITEAGALGFDPAWVEHCQREEFALLVRRAVADRNLSLKEQHKLDQARTLIGIPESEAVATLGAIVAEAEAIFGAKVEGAVPNEAESGQPPASAGGNG